MTSVDVTRLRRWMALGFGAMERTQAHHLTLHERLGTPAEDDLKVLRGLMAFAEVEAALDDVESLDRELRQANFYRDKLAERLSLVETAVVELEGALACVEAVDPDHWRDHARHAMSSALELCRRATKTANSQTVSQDRSG